MYAPFNQPSIATKTVAAATGQAAPGEDGLITLGPPQNVVFNDISIPPRLYDKLLSIRLLSSVPLSYMVPDAAMLPPESIRFFFVDQTWVDRITDGVLAAANTGSVDITFSCGLNQLIRQSLDKALAGMADQQIQTLLQGKGIDTVNWDPGTQPMTGMLIRSDIVRRWPNIGVLAYTSNGGNREFAHVAVLRAEAISQGIYIALFGGTPNRVQILEPHVGLRFGIEVKDENTPEDGNYQVDGRDVTGTPLTPLTRIPVPLRSAASRVLNVSAFASSLPTYVKGAEVGSRLVAMELERQRWVQDYDDTVPESSGVRVEPIDLSKLPPLSQLGSASANLAQAVLEKN